MPEPPHYDRATWDLSRFRPFGGRECSDTAAIGTKDEPGCSPDQLDGGRTVTCQHEGDIQRLLIDGPRIEARTTALEGRVTTIEENIRVQERARELVRSGKSDEQVAAERRRNIMLAVAMLLMPVVTAVLNKLWK